MENEIMQRIYTYVYSGRYDDMTCKQIKELLHREFSKEVVDKALEVIEK